MATLSGYLGEVARALRDGEPVDPGLLAAGALRVRERLEGLRGEVEADPSPPGLEALDQAMLEVLALYDEAVDLVIYAAAEGDREAAEEALQRVQDAVDTLRMAHQTAETHHGMLAEEMSWGG